MLPSFSFVLPIPLLLPLSLSPDRVGSEFWSQTVPIGDVETGIK